MQINKADFFVSSPNLELCPKADKPEYAFIGRSNVGKSSLINMLAGHKNLAKISSAPGKTRLINHFIINDEWYLVDLPGLGYAKISKEQKKTFKPMVYNYIQCRENLLCVFFLVDVRHSPQKVDVGFIDWMGKNGIPFVLLFTKIDKLSRTVLEKNITDYKNFLLETWEELPPIFLTSSVKGIGKEELVKHIEVTNEVFFSSYSGVKK